MRLRSPLRIGMIGAGFMAKVHTRAAVSAGARCVTVAASGSASARRAAASLGYDRAVSNVDALIADPEIDLVHVCTPNASHLPLARAILESGKHVICEKPLATSARDAHDLAALAEAKGLVATVPFVYRFHPVAREARARVAAGDVGRVSAFHGVYLQDWLLDQGDYNWRVEASVGGPSRAFADIGSHLVDLLEFITGERLVRIAARTRRIHASRATHTNVDTEDAAALVGVTSTGAIGTLLVSQVAPGRKNHLVVEIAGRNESLRFEQERPEELWIGRRHGSQILMRDPAQFGADARRLSILPAGHPMGYQDAFDAFVVDSYAAVAGDRRPGLPQFWDGARAALITESVLEADATGAWVEIPTAALVPAGVDTGAEVIRQ